MGNRKTQHTSANALLIGVHGTEGRAGSADGLVTKKNGGRGDKKATLAPSTDSSFFTCRAHKRGVIVFINRVGGSRDKRVCTGLWGWLALAAKQAKTKKPHQY